MRDLEIALTMTSLLLKFWFFLSNCVGLTSFSPSTVISRSHTPGLLCPPHSTQGERELGISPGSKTTHTHTRTHAYKTSTQTTWWKQASLLGSGSQGCVWCRCNSITLLGLVLGKAPVPWETTSLRGPPSLGYSSVTMETAEVMKRVKRRGLKMDDWIRTGRLEEEFLKRGIVEQQLEHRERLPPPYKVRLWVKANRLSHTNPSGAFQRIHFSFSPSHPPPTLSLSPALFFRIVTIVPFTLPVDWSLLSRLANQAGLRHLCKPPSQWQVSLRGRRLNNAGGTPRRLSFSLLLPVSFHVGPDSVLN